MVEITQTTHLGQFGSAAVLPVGDVVVHHHGGVLAVGAAAGFGVPSGLVKTESAQHAEYAIPELFDRPPPTRRSWSVPARSGRR